MQASTENEDDAGELLISDSDRDQISAVLSQHMAEGRLTVDELDQRVGRLYASRTRAQAAAVLADLPPLEAHETAEHFHLGHEPDDAMPPLPTWLATRDVAEDRPSAPPQSRAREEAAFRRRAKEHADKNAIGHTFQARRRAITTELEAAIAAGQRDEVMRLNAELQDAKATAAAARRAEDAGDRAEVQRLLQRLRR
jgi:hypothetical protein